MIIATLLAPLFVLQSSGEAVVAIKNDNPETWTVEYPRLIQPQVQEYRRCLKVTNRTVTGVANFEAQHRTDLDGAKTTMSPEEIERLFDNIGKIHVARGRDLDQQFTSRLSGAEAASTAYEAERPKGLVIELRDASVVKAQTDASAAAAAAKAEASKDTP